MKIEVEVVSQFGRARHLRVKLGDLEFETPNVVVPRGPPPSLEEIGFPTYLSPGSKYNFPVADYVPYGTWAREEEEVIVLHGGIPRDLRKYSLVFVPFAKEFCRSPRKAFYYILNLRKRMREDAILYMSFPLSPVELPLFIYIGVDLFDPFWSKIPEKNGEKMRKMAEKAREWIDSGKLRRKIEIYVRTSQRASSLLKISEKEGYAYLEMGYPVARAEKELMTVFEEALERPDVKRYYQRILSRYSPPKGRKVLLILPCSAKKPYTYSKTHRIVRNALSGIKGYDLVQELIVTSPLGAVPRELEEVYPVKNYDVPVTGYWSEEEIERTLQAVRSLIRKGSYETVLAYVPEEYYFLESLDKVEVIPGEFLKEDSLKKLRERMCDALEGEDQRIAIKEEVARSILSYQFGDAFRFPKGVKVRGRDFRRYRIFLGGEQLAAYDRNRGMFSLTLRGAETLLEGGYFVKIDDFVPKGKVFCAGILEADPRIRKGDEVAVYYEEELRAVGVAMLPGKTLEESRRGGGIKVRHHVRREVKRVEKEILL